MQSNDKNIEAVQKGKELLNTTAVEAVAMEATASTRQWLQKARANPASVLGKFPGQYFCTETNSNGRHARLIAQLGQIMTEGETVLWSGGFNPLVLDRTPDPAIGNSSLSLCAGLLGSLLGMILAVLGVIALLVQPLIGIILIIVGLAIIRLATAKAVARPVEAYEVFYALSNLTLKFFVVGTEIRRNTDRTFSWDICLIDVPITTIELGYFFLYPHSVELSVKLPDSAQVGKLCLRGFSDSEKQSLLT